MRVFREGFLGVEIGKVVWDAFTDASSPDTYMLALRVSKNKLDM